MQEAAEKLIENEDKFEEEFEFLRKMGICFLKKTELKFGNEYGI